MVRATEAAHPPNDAADQRCSAAQAAKLLGITKRTLFKWERDKLVPKPQRIKRGKLEYRAYSQRDLQEIRLFMLSRVPNPDVQIIGNDSDGVPIFGRKLRGSSTVNAHARGPDFEQLPARSVFSSLNEALGATCTAALQMKPTRITLCDAEGRTHTIEIRPSSEHSEARHEK